MVQPFSDFLLTAICCLTSKSQTYSLAFDLSRIPLCLFLLKIFSYLIRSRCRSKCSFSKSWWWFQCSKHNTFAIKTQLYTWTLGVLITNWIFFNSLSFAPKVLHCCTLMLVPLANVTRFLCSAQLLAGAASPGPEPGVSAMLRRKTRNTGIKKGKKGQRTDMKGNRATNFIHLIRLL